MKQKEEEEKLYIIWSTRIGGVKNPPVAILTTKIIKTYFSQVAISKKICNPVTVSCYIHILTGTGCKISLIYFISLCGPTSLFPHSLFSHISASLSLSLLSSHPLSPHSLFYSLLSLSWSIGGIDMEQWTSNFVWTSASVVEPWR